MRARTGANAAALAAAKKKHFDRARVARACGQTLAKRRTWNRMPAHTRAGRVTGGRAPRLVTQSDPGRPALPGHLSSARPGQDICKDWEFKIIF